MIGRRPFFFAFLAAIALILLPFTPTEFRALNVLMAGLALFWSITLAIEELSGAKDAVLRPMGVTVPQYTALLVINDEPGISGAELTVLLAD